MLPAAMSPAHPPTVALSGRQAYGWLSCQELEQRVHFVSAGVVLVLSGLVLSGRESADRRSVNEIPDDCFDSKRSTESFIRKRALHGGESFCLRPADLPSERGSIRQNSLVTAC